MKSKLIDRLTMTFYEETMMDTDLLEMLNRYSQHKFRTAKVKEWAYQYLKEHYADELKELHEEKKEEIKEEIKAKAKGQKMSDEEIEAKLHDDDFWNNIFNM